MKEVYRESLAGVQFSDYQRVKDWTVGKELTLKWERSNRHDPKAIAVYNGEIRIGYIKRNETEVLHQLREKGIKTKTTLVAFNETNPTWHMITVSISVLDKQDEVGNETFVKI